MEALPKQQASLLLPELGIDRHGGVSKKRPSHANLRRKDAYLGHKGGRAMPPLKGGLGTGAIAEPVSAGVTAWVKRPLDRLTNFAGLIEWSRWSALFYHDPRLRH